MAWIPRVGTFSPSPKRAVCAASPLQCCSAFLHDTSRPPRASGHRWPPTPSWGPQPPPPPSTPPLRAARRKRAHRLQSWQVRPSCPCCRRSRGLKHSIPWCWLPGGKCRRQSRLCSGNPCSAKPYGATHGRPFQNSLSHDRQGS